MNESTLVPREEWESDLDWLVRNVHVWPHIAPKIISAGDELFEFGATFYNDWVDIYGKFAGCGVTVTKQQWLARRAELQNKPGWKDARPWANWLSQSEDGEWWFSLEKPECGGSKWSFNSSAAGNSKWKGEILGDWRDTLEKRPETYLKSMSGVHSNGDMATLIDELNDIDESVFGDGFLHKNAATAKQPAPKGSGNPILGMVLADLTNRALEGKEKYGEPLLAHNGRNPLWDAYQEALDLAMYLRQAIEEQK